MTTREFIESRDEMERILQEQTVGYRCFDPGAEEISPDAASKCCAVEIQITEMTGRQEREGKRTYWRTSFGY